MRRVFVFVFGLWAAAINVAPAQTPADARLSLENIYEELDRLAGQNDQATLAQAHAAYEAKDYTAVLRLAAPLAVRGHREAQLMMGEMYYFEDFDHVNLCESFAWYHKAARQGHADAQERLAEFYLYGLGVRKNLGEAYRWAAQSAQSGNKKAQEMLETIRKVTQTNARQAYENTVASQKGWRPEAARMHDFALLPKSLLERLDQKQRDEMRLIPCRS